MSKEYIEGTKLLYCMDKKIYTIKREGDFNSPTVLESEEGHEIVIKGESFLKLCFYPI